ncbi:MAG: Gfo/Idh/MocA family oxidoreductase [Candidatus Poribacteria bacterium]|nr:Gfo/Idh/MocA family oxidoreductase [Candidatus Poribacteria bacterium]
MNSPKFRFAALSVVKHAYVPEAMAAHPRFEPVVVADDPDQPDRVHELNQKFADDYNIPYVRDVERAIAEYNVQVAVVSSEPERHCDLSVRAADAGLHILQDKPMSNVVSECDRVVEAVERNNVKFLLWGRNYIPTLMQAKQVLDSGTIGELYAIHSDFYFAKDKGPPRDPSKPKKPSVNQLERQNETHAAGSGTDVRPLGELQVEGIYPLSAMRMLTGAAVRKVFARTTAHFHQVCVDNDIEDLATVTLEMDKGILGTLCIGRIGSGSHHSGGEIKTHVLGSKGALVISEARPGIYVYYRGQPRSDRPLRGVGGDSTFQLLENLAQAIDTDGDTILNARAGRAICATVQAAMDSGRSGTPVTVS